MTSLPSWRTSVPSLLLAQLQYHTGPSVLSPHHCRSTQSLPLSLQGRRLLFSSLAREAPTPAPLLAHTLPVRFPAAPAAPGITEERWGEREMGGTESSQLPRLLFVFLNPSVGLSRSRSRIACWRDQALGWAPGKPATEEETDTAALPLGWGLRTEARLRPLPRRLRPLLFSLGPHQLTERVVQSQPKV